MRNHRSSTNRDSHSLCELRERLLRAKNLLRIRKTVAAKKTLEDLITDLHGLLNPPELLKQAQSLEAQIERNTRLRTNRLLLLGVLLISGLVLILLVNRPKRDIPMYVELWTQRLDMDLVETLRIMDFDVETIKLNGLDTVHTFGDYEPTSTRSDQEPTPPAGGSRVGDDRSLEFTPAAPNFSLTSDSEGMYVESLLIGNKVRMTDLSVTKKGGELMIEAPLGDFSGELQVGEMLILQCYGSRLNGNRLDNSAFTIFPQEPITFSGKKHPNIVVVRRNSHERHTLAANFAISDISFRGLEEDTDRSALISGEIRFVSSSFEPLLLEEGDSLSIDPTNHLEVIKLDYGPDLRLRITGEVHELKRNKVSILPSQLAWIHQSNNGYVLYLAALSSMVSFIWLIFRRLEIVR